jgi:hypothetical protein
VSICQHTCSVVDEWSLWDEGGELIRWIADMGTGMGWI